MSPRSREQFEEIRENRRKQIMDTALELFASEGYSHCSIAMLAGRAGISKGLMYNYFESKEALLMALINDGSEDILNLMDPNHDGVLSPDEAEHFIRTTFQTIRTNTKFWILFLSVVLQPKVREFLNGQPFRTILERLEPMLFSYFKAQGFEDPELEMLTLSALIEGFAMMLVYFHPHGILPAATMDKYEERVIRMFVPKQKNP
ncbi:MAG: TetR/AcrR family transcriptional regulator [Bacteroidales bacterium]